MNDWQTEEENFLSLIAKLVCEFVEDKVDKVYLYCYKENEAISHTFFYEKNRKIYSREEIISILGFPYDEKWDALIGVIKECFKYWNDLLYIWNHNIFNNCMEIKCIYTLETKSIEIFRSFDMIEDENYYIYAEEVWLDELKIACGQKPVGELREKCTSSELQVIEQKSNDWKELFSSCLGKMTAIQLACDQYVVKNQNWNVNFQEGLISFGEAAYPIQFLGSESNQTNTWLWGWENVNQFDTQLLQLVEQVRQYGEEKALAPLQKAELMLDDDINGHTLSIVACGIQEPPVCYYRCPHANGAAFVALTDIPEDVFQPVDAWKFMNIVAQCLKTHIVDQKIFVESFLNWNQTAYTWNGMVLTAQFHQPMEIEFEIVEGMWRVKQLLLV